MIVNKNGDLLKSKDCTAIIMRVVYFMLYSEMYTSP
jgi:hypothetical protein